MLLIIIIVSNNDNEKKEDTFRDKFCNIITKGLSSSKEKLKHNNEITDIINIIRTDIIQSLLESAEQKQIQQTGPIYKIDYNNIKNLAYKLVCKKRHINFLTEHQTNSSAPKSLSENRFPEEALDKNQKAFKRRKLRVKTYQESTISDHLVILNRDYKEIEDKLNNISE